jgi:hydrogenase maturation factor HypF (carbamoyltransferase family)
MLPSSTIEEICYISSSQVVSSQVIGDTSAARVADYMGETLEENRLSRQYMMDRVYAAKSPKTASQYFTPEWCARLMTKYGVMNEGDLPEIWRLLPQYGERTGSRWSWL